MGFFRTNNALIMKRILFFLLIVNFAHAQLPLPAVMDGGAKIVTSSLNTWIDMAQIRSYITSPVQRMVSLINSTYGDLQNGANFDPTKGGCVNFDKVNDWVNFYSAYNFTSQPFSFNIWVNFSSLVSSNSGQAPVLLYKGSFQANGYYLQVNSTGLSFATNQSGAIQASSGSFDFNINTWYNICVTRSGSSVRLYVDGNDITTTAATHLNPTLSNIDFALGAYSPYSGGFFMGGKIAYFNVYEKQLTTTEVLQNYNALKNRYK